MAQVSVETFTQFVTDAPAAAAPSSGDYLALIQGGVTKRLDASQISGGGSTVLVTSGNYQVVNGVGFVEVKKTVGAATTITLPPSPVDNAVVTVKDGKGDAGTNAITITGGTIDGLLSTIIRQAFGAVSLRWDGTQWRLF